MKRPRSIEGYFTSSKPPRRSEDAQRLETVISGGQTGADRAALEAAEALGIRTGGWAPTGFWTSHGQDLALRDRFHLKEIVLTAEKGCTGHSTIAAAYVRRSMANVDDADGTVAFRIHASPGTDKTIAYAQSGQWGQRRAGGVCTPHRPCLVIPSLDDAYWESNLDAFRQFMMDHRITKLNICGHREAPSSCPHYVEDMKAFLMQGFAHFR